MSLLTNQPFNQSINQSTSHWIIESFHKSPNQVNHSVSNEAVNPVPITKHNQSTSKWIYWSIDQSINQIRPYVLYSTTPIAFNEIVSNLLDMLWKYWMAKPPNLTPPAQMKFKALVIRLSSQKSLCALPLWICKRETQLEWLPTIRMFAEIISLIWISVFISLLKLNWNFLLLRLFTLALNQSLITPT